MRQPLAVLPFCALLPLLPAQGDFDLDKVTAGRLGASLDLRVRNAPGNRLLLWMMSGNQGPTPFATFDPTDPRAASVGLDLTHGWLIHVTTPTGAANASFALPASPVLNGYTVYWQAVTLPGASTFVDQVSNPVTTQLGLTGTSNALPGGLSQPRAGTPGFAFPGRNAGMGDFVLPGGLNAEIWDFRTLRGVPGAAMAVPRVTPTVTVLNDGRVLIAGGIDLTGAPLSSCEIFDPATNTFTATGNLAGPRALHAAVRMADGRVMVAGGTNNTTDLLAIIGGVQNTTEIFNPATGTWSNGPNLSGRRVWPALTLLNTGRVMVSGGVEVTLFLGIPLAATSTTRTQLYNPATNSWSNGASMPNGRASHDVNQVTLADGRVLMTGGVLVPDLANAANAAMIQAADVYNPATNTWAAYPMSQARSLHSATRLPDGRVLVCGGSQGLLSAPTTTDTVELFDPASNSWTTLAPLSTPRTAHAAVVLPDGMVVLLGGDSTGAGAEALHF